MFVSNQFYENAPITERLDSLPDNTSDHYPLCVTFTDTLQEHILKTEASSQKLHKKIMWTKVDKDKYQQILNNKLGSLDIIQEPANLLIYKLTDILKEAQQIVTPQAKPSSKKRDISGIRI